MEEDVAGTQAAGTRRTYATCAECGAVFMRQGAHTEPSSVTDNAHSEFSELCESCMKLDAQGERPVVSDEEG
jgi:hypothetical protein